VRVALNLYHFVGSSQSHPLAHAKIKSKSSTFATRLLANLEKYFHTSGILNVTSLKTIIVI
jgi:hypothetical protein